MQNDITWDKFKFYNPDTTHAFENMCRLLFKHEFCPTGTVLFSEQNHPGVEVEPVLSNKGKWISFQSKFFDKKVKYVDIQKSANATVKYYDGKLDVWYLYCNLPIKKDCPSFQNISKTLKDKGIEIEIVVNDEILTTVLKYSYIMDAFFGLKTLPMSWFKNQVNDAVGDLGIRYNKAFNVETEALNAMDLFVGNKQGIAALNGRKKTVLDSIIEHCNNLGYKVETNYDYIEKCFSLISELPDVGMTDYAKAIEWYDDIEKALYHEKKQIDEKIQKIKSKESSNENREYLKELYWEKEIVDKLKFDENEIRLIKNKMLIVNGRYGTGHGKRMILWVTSYQKLCYNYFKIVMTTSIYFCIIFP